jgi:hypothetical protein
LAHSPDTSPKNASRKMLVEPDAAAP